MRLITDPCYSTSVRAGGCKLVADRRLDFRLRTADDSSPLNFGMVTSRMFSSDQYKLLDFGAGRKLERFGKLVLDRPSPAAEHATPFESSWQSDLRFDRSRGDEGQWTGDAPSSGIWQVQHAGLQMELRPTPFGHVGVFPEQASNWDWIAKQVGRFAKQSNEPMRLLNLFGYTGGSTLAAAAAGAEVTHVDASKTVVRWARDNAANSGLQDRPIRWIHDDALKFARRELKRSRTYHGVILDPPTYGHGPQGESWKIAKHLPQLLEVCAQLTQDNRQLMLLSCHSPGYGEAEIEAILADCVFGTCQCNARSARLKLSTAGGRDLDCGVMARWPGTP